MVERKTMYKKIQKKYVFGDVTSNSLEEGNVKHYGDF